MPDPIHPVLAGAAIGASISLTGTVLGAQADALVLGLLAASFVSAWLHEINSLGRAAAAVCLSALLAGYGSPVAAQWLSSSSLGVQGGESLRLLLALGIGAAAPGVVPLLLTRARGIAQGDAK